MSLSAIREQVKTAISAADPKAIVHDYQRWALLESSKHNLFKDEDGRLHTWMITRIKAPEKDSDSTVNTRSHGIKIIGAYSVNDEDGSEIVFQALIEDVCDGLRAAYQLNGTAHHTSPPSVAVIDYRRFGGVLCHYAEITMEAEELKAWST